MLNSKERMGRSSRKIVTLFCLFLFSLSVFSQTSTVSPYSRYGLGDLSNGGFVQNTSMGGIGIALQNDSTTPFFNNVVNPASYVSNRITTYEAGLSSNTLSLHTGSTKQTVNSTSIGYLAFAMPLTKWWGTSFGLMPYSSVGYKVSDHKTLDSIGDVDYLYEGSGGINRLYLGNGIQPFANSVKNFHKTSSYKTLVEQMNKYRLEKDTLNLNKVTDKIYHLDKRHSNIASFSMGVNASFLFGNLDNTRRVIYPNTSLTQFYYNTKSSSTTRIRNLYFDYGLQQSFRIDSFKKRKLKEKVKVTLGATLGLASDLNAKRDVLSFNYFNSGFGYEVVKDTIENYTAKEGTISLPLTFGAGFAVKKGERWLLGADYSYQNWSKFSSFGETSDLKNSMRISLGGQYTPNKFTEAKGTYWKRVQYRAGLHYYNTYLDLKDTQLTEYSLGLGLGLPVGRRYINYEYSVLNLGLEVGQRGTTDNGLVKEQFFKVVVGFTINNKWFQKTKFD